jgi:hypothetical protein
MFIFNMLNAFSTRHGACAYQYQTQHHTARRPRNVS